ncbi:hypothetical protein ACJJTC_015760 [Scirpophaga incertulas]
MHGFCHSSGAAGLRRPPPPTRAYRRRWFTLTPAASAFWLASPASLSAAAGFKAPQLAGRLAPSHLRGLDLHSRGRADKTTCCRPAARLARRLYRPPPHNFTPLYTGKDATKTFERNFKLRRILVRFGERICEMTQAARLNVRADWVAKRAWRRCVRTIAPPPPRTSRLPKAETQRRPNLANDMPASALRLSYYPIDSNQISLNQQSLSKNKIIASKPFS